MRATAYDEITPLEPEWLWPGRIPLSQTTIVAGDGGIGKGFLTADIAARVTRGAPMPDGTGQSTPGSVIFVSLEDDPSMAMAYRLRAAGADLSKVYDFSDGFQWGAPPGEGDSLPELKENIAEIGDVRLLVIDPLSAASGISINSGTQKIRRQLMMPMERVCRDNGIASVVIAHTIKNRRTIAGSKAITDAARMVLRVTVADTDESIKLIHVEKTNIASSQTGDVAYRVGGQFPDVRVEYLAVPEDDTLETKPPTVADLVIMHLTDIGTPVETQKLAVITGQSYGAVRVALTRLKASGQVQNPARGLWALAPAVPASLEVVR